MSKRKNGFTIIELLVYIAILAFLIGGGVASAFAVLDFSEQNKADINVQAEGQFLMRKIEWALTDVAPGGVTILALDILQTNKNGVGIIVIDAPSGRARISVAGGSQLEITNDRVQVQNLSFDHILPAGTKPEAIHATFDINGVSFSTTRYLRK